MLPLWRPGAVVGHCGRAQERQDHSDTHKEEIAKLHVAHPRKTRRSAHLATSDGSPIPIEREATWSGGSLPQHRHPDRRRPVGRERARHFRDKGERWSQVPLEEVAKPEGFAPNASARLLQSPPAKRHRDARPNAAHTALARLERDHTGNVLTVTQNIDALHEVAGTRNLIHMHGELTRALCAACGTSTAWSEDLTVETACLACGEAAMRPDVVWFGEMPREMDARGMRPVHLHRHERQRLSGRRLCGGGETRRRAHGRAQS